LHLADNRHAVSAMKVSIREGDVFAARQAVGELHIPSIGAENCYAVDIERREFCARDVPADLRVHA
jgi:hypothetical protein